MRRDGVMHLRPGRLRAEVNGWNKLVGAPTAKEQDQSQATAADQCNQPTFEARYNWRAHERDYTSDFTAKSFAEKKEREREKEKEEDSADSVFSAVKFS